jgi:hypothetical protein
MNVLKSGAAALGIVLTAAPLAAHAQAPSASPIAITNCSVLRYQRDPGRRYWYPWGFPPNQSLYTDGVDITYVNNTPKVASRVAFVVNYRGDIQHIVDVGTFSPGVSIDHTFGQFTGDAFLGTRPNTCRVAAVRFSDGSVWRAQPMPRG